MKKYQVKEIFGPTLQGEGIHTGECVFFVRLSKCNRWNGREASKPNSVCYYCDTDFNGGEQMTADEILKEVFKLHTESFRPTIVISGGEPMLQVDRDLAQTLHSYADLHIETNGSIAMPLDVQNYFKCITVSPKQGPAETLVKNPHALKFLYPWVGEDVKPENFNSEYSQIYIQPIDGPKLKENTEGAIKVCLSNPDYRLSIQTHKILDLK